MPYPDRGQPPRFNDLADAGPAAARPQIWVEGRQQPRFDIRAWTRVSLAMARRRLGPRLTAGAARVDSFGQGIVDGWGKVNVAWAGRAARLVPSHQSVGAVVAGFGQLMAEAREIVLPSPPPLEPVAYPNLIRPNFTGRAVGPLRALREQAAFPQPATAAAPVPLPQPSDEPALHAIRSLIDEPETASRPRDTILPELEKPIPTPPTLGQSIRATLAYLARRTAAHGMAWGLTGLMFPVGGIHAALFHLNGGDLRDWS